MYAIRLGNGGEYALEFVQVLPANYTCTNCHQFLGEPHQNVECGDRFCAECVRLITNGSKECPACSVPMTAETTFVDVAVRREIDELEVCCPFKRYDCEQTLLYRNLKDHLEACSKKPVGTDASADNVSSAAMTALERGFEKLEKTVQDLQLKFDGVHNQVSSLVLWKSNNTMTSRDCDAGATRPIGEMARGLNSLENMAQRVCPVHALTSIDANALETRISRLTSSLQGVFARIDRVEQTIYDGVLIWKIDNFRQKKNDNVNRSVYSSPFYSHRFGYKMCVRVYPNGEGTGRDEYLSVFLVLMKGEHDAILRFPFCLRVEFTLMDQDDQSNDYSECFDPEPESISFQRPADSLNVGSGFPQFVQNNIVETPTYLKDDCIYLRVAVGKD